MSFEDCIFKPVCTNNCSNSCIRYVEMDYMLRHSNIPKAKQKITQLTPEDCDLEAFTQLANIRDNIVDFINNGNSLYIYSTICGNGKTTWSIKLMLQYFNEIWAGNGFTKRGIFVHTPTFLSKCKDLISHKDEEFDELKHSIIDVDLVIWDDIAASKISDYDYSLLLMYIDQRVLAGRSNIYTGNIIPSNLDKNVGVKLASRICGINSTIIEFKGGDNR